jgi:hypothetical protein
MLFSKHENRMSPAQVRLGAGSVVHHTKSDRSMSVQGHEPSRQRVTGAAERPLIADTKAHGRAIKKRGPKALGCLGPKGLLGAGP